MFEHILTSVIGRLIKHDDSSQDTKDPSKTELKLEKKVSLVDSNATEGLLNQGFEIIFKEMTSYISDTAITATSIDHNTFLKVNHNKSLIKPFDVKDVQVTSWYGAERSRNKREDTLELVEKFKEIPWMKEIKVLCADYVEGIQIFYEDEAGK
jgi:hypothetical protein